MAGERRYSYKNGYWVWDDLNNALLFVKHDLKDFTQRVQSVGGGSQCSNTRKDISQEMFKETTGKLSQVRFRKHYQRKVKVTEPEVVTLQDLKDVTIFTCEISFLTHEFINFFHTKSVDNFLRSLIIYFQYYFQVWNDMLVRRTEMKRKIQTPALVALEDTIRDNLADLRSMVARDYAVLLTGTGDAKKFHHMNKKNNISLSDMDRRLYEVFILMVQRVTWIALKRKFMTLIEREINRLLRTDSFSPVENKNTKSTVFDATPEETKILEGKTCMAEKKLLHRSSLVQEIIFANHDYAMLAIGVTDTGISTERQKYLEAAYTAPEELLETLGVGVGILGVPRKYLDAMLKPKELSTTEKRDSIMKPIPDFIIPQKEVYEKIPETLQTKPCKYQETKSAIAARKFQRKIWNEYLEMRGQLPSTALEMQSLTPSYMTLRTSIAPVYSKYN